MDMLQHILVYITLSISIVYLVNKFLIPKSLWNPKKKNNKACGQNDCGCH
ncbi:hypothetical protein SAMN04488009_0492 [Maribacter sedimenticola]|uniref:Virus attachment protein p12 family protein n=1 Tax=Maribacter sedimenticola TaxID=228956 RepID=A0ABY1SCJ2_9FLAO|nr:hypothetical protein SAMN04488009_0492 [Maribacter sedimenticola]